jgi:hypothetical protein
MTIVLEGMNVTAQVGSLMIGDVEVSSTTFGQVDAN